MNEDGMPIRSGSYDGEDNQVEWMKEWVANSQKNCLHLQLSPIDLDGICEFPILTHFGPQNFVLARKM